MDLLAERGRRVSVDELNTTRLLAHARKQAVQRKFDDILIVDVDAHHYENEHYSEILPYMENDVFKQWTMGGRGQTDRGSIVPTNAGFIARASTCALTPAIDAPSARRMPISLLRDAARVQHYRELDAELDRVAARARDHHERSTRGRPRPS